MYVCIHLYSVNRCVSGVCQVCVRCVSSVHHYVCMNCLSHFLAVKVPVSFVVDGKILTYMVRSDTVTVQYVLYVSVIIILCVSTAHKCA